ncbi:helix-turn-helix domain-containing protein [Corynebacterium sp. USCH3]|uniref:helix-turn-helix domain-containing protein n=1 Tax=Corynebacterium sp. USCH3 TaxID=3024840 RepID=UPI0030A99B83
MSSGRTGDTGGDHEWLALVDELDEEVPLLVEEFLSELLSSGLYSGDLVTREDLADSAAETFVFLIDRLRSPLDAPDRHLIARRLGRHRARQGVAMQDLVDAVQLDFPVLWRRLRRHAGEERMGVLIDHVERVHVVVDRYSFSVREEFIRESARIAQNVSIANQRHLARLFAEGPVNVDVLGDVATGLGVDVDASYELAVISPEHVGAVGRAIGDELADGTLFGHELGPTLAVLRPPERTLPLDRLIGECAGVLFRDVRGLAAVRVTARGAVEMLRSHPALSRLHPYTDLLPGAALRYIRTRLVPGFLREESEAIGELVQDESDQLVPTVRTFLRTGTVKATASALYCHRNTVVNRLNSFARATGLDVARPTDAAVVQLLLPVAP